MGEMIRESAKKSEAKIENKPPQMQKAGPSQFISSPVDQILFLQRTIGNQAVGRLIKSGALQAKLRIGQPGDIYEQEADRVAEQVMRMPEPQVSKETKVSHPARNISIQRKCPGCNKETKIEEEVKLQKKEASGSTHEVTSKLESSISAIRGGGQPLPESVRAFYEPRFGQDFGGVRVHTDAKAAEAARAVNARAFTIGKDVGFGAREFAPGTVEGQKLLAHELTHVVQQGWVGLGRLLAGTIQRQQVVPASDRDLREFIRDTIFFLNSSADFYRDMAIDKALFERVINSWYLMVVDREKTIDDRLGGDALLRRELRSAYTVAIRVLMSRAARALGKNEEELYRENSGRIPIWVWQTPHHTEIGISTPVAQGRGADVITGEVTFLTNGFQVMIAKDSINPNLGNRAETKFDISWGNIHWQYRGGIITSVNGPGAPSVRIQTSYGGGVTASSPSGYGRGTTAEDIAGGRVTPKSTSLGFHEGHHGLDFLDFLKNNTPPHFNGAVGMRVAQIQAASNLWRNGCSAYVRTMNEFSIRRTDCVGTTIDQSRQAHAAPGAQIVHVCNP